MRTLLLLGAGGFGKTVADMARQLGVYDKIVFLDDGKTGGDILGRCADFPKFCDNNTDAYPAIGNNSVRMAWLQKLQEAGISVPTLIHPAAYVSPTAVVGTGTVVLARAVVNTGVTVEDGCIVNIGGLVDHDCILEKGTHICPGAIVKAENRIAAGSKIESGDVILNRTYPL